ncbi:MAG: hypothetical protein JXR62_01330 [Bacilli bacterium]|nr:hypothetical protein [Bacilli bacterium]
MTVNRMFFLAVLFVFLRKLYELTFVIYIYIALVVLVQLIVLALYPIIKKHLNRSRILNFGLLTISSLLVFYIIYSSLHPLAKPFDVALNGTFAYFVFNFVLLTYEDKGDLQFKKLRFSMLEKIIVTLFFLVFLGVQYLIKNVPNFYYVDYIGQTVEQSFKVYRNLNENLFLSLRYIVAIIFYYYVRHNFTEEVPVVKSKYDLLIEQTLNKRNKLE